MQIGQPVGGENIVEIQHGSAAAATATAAQPPIGAGVTTAIGNETKHPESPEIRSLLLQPGVTTQRDGTPWPTQLREQAAPFAHLAARHRWTMQKEARSLASKCH